MNFTLVSHQDGEVDMKLLTKVLASEQEVKEVSEFFVNIACDLLEKACPAVSSTQGGLPLCLPGNQDLWCVH